MDEVFINLLSKNKRFDFFVEGSNSMHLSGTSIIWDQIHEGTSS